MPDANAQDGPADPDRTDRTAASLDEWLHEVSRRIDPADSSELTELGLYSIHEGAARTITLPADAERFEDTTSVKQYYYPGGECPLLIIAGITF